MVGKIAPHKKLHLDKNHNISQNQSLGLVFDDNKLFRRVALDMTNQKVLRNDVERTKVSDNSIRDKLELILTYYCKDNQLKYKQGLNEIMGVFL